jgi:nucleotide-binding universal stress UspA family protein
MYLGIKAFLLIICAKPLIMKSILVPTDFSENAANATEYAAVIAESTGATVTLLHVYTPAVSRFSVISALLTEEVKEAKKESREKLQVIVGTLRSQYSKANVNAAVAVGEAIPEILQAIKDVHVDMIVMGTQGISSLQKFFLGSNASSIVEKATCPVMVIPAAAQCSIPKKIVYATDYSYSDIESARTLTEIAAVFKATITFVHITTEDEEVDDEVAFIDKFTNEIKEATGYNQINSHILSDATVIMGLDSLVNDRKADLLAIATRRRNIFEKLYNPSITRKLAQYTRIPLLAFKAGVGR